MAITRRTFNALSTAAAGAALVPGTATANATITSHGLSAFGDLKYPAGFTHFDYANPDAPKGGLYSSLGTGARQTFDSLNPFIQKGAPAQGVAEFTLDTLMVSAGDEADALYGLIAQSVEYPEDRSWIRFVLRPEAAFADGSPITADDVVFSYEILRDEGDLRYRNLYRAFTEVVAEDTHNVRFTFDADAPKRDLPMLAASLQIMSRAFWEGKDFARSSLDPILGSGPYAIDKVEPGRSITYRRREDYWAKDLPVNRGRWNFERIRYEYFRDRTAAFEAFKSGAFRFHEDFFSKNWATGYDFPAVNSGAVKKDVLPDKRTAGTQGWWFNMRREKFQDPRVREAIGMGFDFEWSNSVLFYDLYERTDSFFEGGPMQAEGPPTPGELRYLEPLAEHFPKAVFTDPAYVPPKSDGSGRNRRPLRRAAALLDEAGWTVGDDKKRRNAKGEQLTFEVLGSSSLFERIVNPYLKNLEKIGIDATFRMVDHSQYEERMKKFEFDMTVQRLVMSLTPGTALRLVFGSDAADDPNSRNITGLKNAGVDTLLEEIVNAKSREDLSNAVKALDRVLRATHIWVPNWTKGSHTVAFWDVFGRLPVEKKPDYERGVIDLWWIDQDKMAALRDQLQD